MWRGLWECALSHVPFVYWRAEKNFEPNTEMGFLRCLCLSVRVMKKNSVAKFHRTIWLAPFCSRSFVSSTFPLQSNEWYIFRVSTLYSLNFHRMRLNTRHLPKTYIYYVSSICMFEHCIRDLYGIWAHQLKPKTYRREKKESNIAMGPARTVYLHRNGNWMKSPSSKLT